MKKNCIITSASDKFFPSLLNLLGSIKVNYPNHPDVYVYDLGLFYTFRKELESIDWVHVLEVPHFIPHWRSCYTWKTHILNTPLTANNLYIDAGCQVLKSLDTLFDKIENQGYLAIDLGAITINEITPKEYMNIFGLNKNDFNSKAITAGMFGFKKNSIIKKVTERLYKAGVDGFCLGFSSTELWKNKGVNKNSFVRNCKMFRHDTTVVSLVLKKEIPDAILEPANDFAHENRRDNPPYIWNLRMNYKKLDFIKRNILNENNHKIYPYINRMYIQIFFVLKRQSNYLKQKIK